MKTISTKIISTKTMSMKTIRRRPFQRREFWRRPFCRRKFLTKTISTKAILSERISEEDHFDEENFWQRPFRQFNLSKILLFETEASCSEAPVFTWPKPGPKSNLQVCCKIYCRSPFMLTPKPKRSIRNIINVLFCLPPSYDKAWFRDNMQDKNWRSHK